MIICAAAFFGYEAAESSVGDSRAVHSKRRQCRRVVEDYYGKEECGDPGSGGIV